MSTTTIRRACHDDWQQLVAFNQAMAFETEGKTLDEKILARGVERVLTQDNYGFYLVAVNDNQVVASLMVTFEWSDWRNAQFWWIQSVYVLPEFRRQGVYSALYAKVQEIGQKAGNVCGYRLYVEKDNTSAQSTYESLNMEDSIYYMYESK